MMIRRRTIRLRAVTAIVMALALTLSLFGNVSQQRAYGDAIERLVVYDEELSNDWTNYGWADMDLAASEPTHEGSRSIRLKPDGDKALYFYKDRIMNADDYESLTFWIHGGDAGGQAVKLVVSLGGQPAAERMVGDLLDGGIPAGKWGKVTLDLADAGIRGIIDGIWLWGEGSQSNVYVDDMAFEPREGGSTGEEPGGEEPGGEEPSEQPVTSILFAQPQLVVKAGGMRPAVLTAVHADGSLSQLTEGAAWSSSDELVATVSQGLVQGLSEGTAVIKAEYNGLEAVIPVEVQARGNTLPTEPVDGVYVYADAVGEGFTDYGWAQHSLDESDTVRSGDHAIRFEADGDGALYFYADRFVSVKEYEKLRFYVNGGETGGQALKVTFTQGGQPVRELPLSEVLLDGIPAGEWAEVTIMLPDLDIPDRIFDGLRIAGTTGGDQATVYVDDIALIKKYVAPPATLEVRMTTEKLIMLPGENQRLDAEALLSNAETVNISADSTWASDNEEVVRVNGGVLEAVSTGIAKITATHPTGVATAYVQVAELAAETVYAEGLEPGYHNWSWHDKDFANAEQAHGGNVSIKFEPDGWDGVWIVKDKKETIGEYYGMSFWIYGTPEGGQQLQLHAFDGQNTQGTIDLNRYFPEGGLPAGQWTEVVVNFADMGLYDGEFDGFVLQAGTEDNQPAVYVDDIALLRNLHPGQLPEVELPSVDIAVDPSADRRAINPEIYGINYDDMHPTESQLAFPVQRWGGNNTTRYNWELDTTNRASDWYFINYPYDNDNPEQLPEGSESDRFMDMVHDKGGNVLLTIPTIGWTPKDRTVTYGFSREKYGDQQSYAGELRDAGNGVHPNGEWMKGNDPTDTSKRVGVDFATRWMDHIEDRTGDRVNYYALDNEPEIWHVTHRDVHPEAPTYDEIWSFTERYGAAIKAKDPDAQVFGPTSWGWCAYFYSSADNCAEGPDRAAHDNAPFLEWYLKQVAAYEARTNVRLVDYLDIHYYSQEDVVPGFEEGPYAAKRRFQALKALYDPNFVDHSWIQEPIRLIPRMKDMINAHLPGVKLAITEYNFGNGNGITAGLAQAEALAIFGREGVDLATRFGTLPAGTPLEDAFKLYLNYDGNGSTIEGASVRALSSNGDAVGSYAIDGADGKLYVLLFNKDTVSRTANVVTGTDGGQADLYRFSAKSRLGHAGTASVDAEGKASLKLPARSATLVVVER